MEDNGALLPSMLVPLCMLNTSYNHHQSTSDHHRQLALVDPTATASSRFRVPGDWVVQEVPLLKGNKIDKFYYEPESGKRCRSSKDVERYLNGDVYIPKQKALKLDNCVNSSCPRKMIVSGGQFQTCLGKQIVGAIAEAFINGPLRECSMIFEATMLLKLDEEGSDQLQLAVVSPTATSSTLRFKLPDGWIVEAVPRKNTHIDKYYYEPRTGWQFRSLVSVERYLEETSAFPMKNNSRENMSLKVNWVLAFPGGDSWSAFMGESEVPDYVRQEGAARFRVSMIDQNYKVSK